MVKPALLAIAIATTPWACAEPAQTAARATPVAAEPTSPPAAKHSDVPPGYGTAIERTRERGRAIAADLLAGNYAEVHARFADKIKPLLGEDLLKKTMDAVRAAGTLSDRLAESVLPGSYIAEHEVAGQRLALTIGFDPDGAVTMLLLKPRASLDADPHADYDSKTEFRLPFSGTWWVFWGGDTELSNYHVVAPDQRHAYDVLMWKDGATHTGDGTENEQYWAFGQTLVAPAKGTVISTANDLRDNNPGVQTDAKNPIGNHVILDVGSGEYVVMAHMQKGSVRVKAGDRVEVGQILGKCGNSGNTSEPHLHIHLQDQPKPFGDARGLPLKFSNYVADDARVERASPVQGQFVRNQR